MSQMIFKNVTKFKFPTPKQQKKTRQKIEKKHPKTPPTTTRFLLKGRSWYDNRTLNTLIQQNQRRTLL